MATDDQKLETFKGEVRRILVDLRALVMRVDSPLSEFAYARQLAIFRGKPGASALKPYPGA